MDIAQIQAILAGEDHSELETYLSTTSEQAALADSASARVAELEAAMADAAAASAATIAELKARNYDLMVGAASAGEPVDDTGDDLPDDEVSEDEPDGDLDDYL